MKTFLKVKSKIVELLTSQTVAVFFFLLGKGQFMSSKLYSKILTKSPIASFTEIGLRGAN